MGMTEERLIAIETDETDKTLKDREMRLTFSTGRTEIVHADRDYEKFKDRVFTLGDLKKDIQ
jgi:hypothetical protein